MIEAKIIDHITPTLNKIINQGFVNAGLAAMAEHLRNELIDYPSSTDANIPGRVKDTYNREGNIRQVPVGYYERGRGYWSPRIQRETIRQIVAERKGKGKSFGVIGARKSIQSIARVAGYVLTSFSETLNRKWTIASRSKTEVVLGTNVSYARFVQDAERQARWMKEYGWTTVQAILQRDKEMLKRKFLAEFSKELRRNV